MNQERRTWDWNRILSGLITVPWLALCAFAGGASAVLEHGMLLLVPVACIWYADALVELIMRGYGPKGAQSETTRAPGCAMRAVAWMVLLGLTLVRGMVALLTAAWWG